MLTQRTTAKFQRLLSSLMQHGFFGQAGIYTILAPANYYNLLYEADLPRHLLDVLMNRTYFNAIAMPLALYEGQAVAEARGHSYVTDDDRQTGISYLLCCIAVAFRAYEQLDWERRSIFEDSARELMESLQQDGFLYQSGGIYDRATGDRINPLPLGAKPATALPAKSGASAPGELAATPAPVASPNAPTPDSGKPIWVAIIGAVAVIIAAYISYLGVSGGFSNSSFEYTGRVKNDTGAPIPDARVSIAEDQRPPQVIRTDSVGVFSARLSKKTQHLALEIDADGFEPYILVAQPSRTGLEPITLVRKKSQTGHGDPKGECVDTDESGYCVRCKRFISYNLAVDNSSPFECRHMKPGSDIQATFDGHIYVDGLGPGEHMHASTSIELRQYDDSDEKNPYHLQDEICPGTQCSRTVGNVPSLTPEPEWHRVAIPVLTKVPSTGNARFEVRVLAVRADPKHPLSHGEGTLTVESRY